MYEKTPILERGTAQRLRLRAESFQNAPYDVPWSRPGEHSTKTGFKHAKVKGQGQMYEKTPIWERGPAQRLRLPAESFQNAPYDVPWPRPGGHSTKTGFKYFKVKGQGQMYDKTPILTHYHAQCAGLPFKLVQNTNTF